MQGAFQCSLSLLKPQSQIWKLFFEKNKKIQKPVKNQTFDYSGDAKNSEK